MRKLLAVVLTLTAWIAGSIVGSIGVCMSTSFQENADAAGRRSIDIVSGITSLSL